MLRHLGLESEQRHANRHATGRRHIPHGGATAQRPAHMSAPYATGAEEPRPGARPPAVPGRAESPPGGHAGGAGRGDQPRPFHAQEGGHLDSDRQMDGLQYPPHHSSPYASLNGNGDYAQPEPAEYTKVDGGHGSVPSFDNYVDYARYTDENNNYVRETVNSKDSQLDVRDEKNSVSKGDCYGHVGSKVRFDDYDYSKGQFDDYTKPKGGYEEDIQVNNKTDYASRENEYDYLLQARNEYANGQPANFEYEEEAPPKKPVKADNSALPSAGLKTSRLSRGELNIFRWNNEAPTVQPPRVMRNRGESELQLLRPQDSNVERDKEVRDKFESNTSGCFLRFSENPNKHQGRPRGALQGNPHAIPAATLTLEQPPRHGRRQSGKVETESNEQIIAGFAGMGARGSEKPFRIQRKSPQTSNIF